MDGATPGWCGQGGEEQGWGSGDVEKTLGCRRGGRPGPGRARRPGQQQSLAGLRHLGVGLEAWGGRVGQQHTLLVPPGKVPTRLQGAGEELVCAESREGRVTPRHLQAVGAPQEPVAASRVSQARGLAPWACSVSGGPSWQGDQWGPSPPASQVPVAAPEQGGPRPLPGLLPHCLAKGCKEGAGVLH